MRPTTSDYIAFGKILVYAMIAQAIILICAVTLRNALILSCAQVAYYILSGAFLLWLFMVIGCGLAETLHKYIAEGKK